MRKSVGYWLFGLLYAAGFAALCNWLGWESMTPDRVLLGLCWFALCFDATRPPRAPAPGAG